MLKLYLMSINLSIKKAAVRFRYLAAWSFLLAQPTSYEAKPSALKIRLPHPGLGLRSLLTCQGIPLLIKCMT